MEATTKFTTRLWTKAERLLDRILYYWNRFILRRTIDSPPAFIVGCGHSGTSILLSILSSHPRIYAVPYESSIARGDNILKFQAAQKGFDRLAIAAGKRRWVEKTPKHILDIGKILKWQPSVKIILILRNGRDVAYSIQKRTGSLETGIRRWCEDNLAAREYWGNPNVHVMKYEDVVSDFETTIADVLSFLDEEYDYRMKDYFKSKKRWYSRELSNPGTPYGKNHEQYRNWQINQPLFDGRARYKEMSAEELDFVEKIGGSMLVEFGYSAVNDETSEGVA